MLGVTYDRWVFWRSILWCCEMMLSQINVADDVIVTLGVFARTEVPRLLLWIIISLFKSLHFVLKVYNVEGLLISEGSVLKERMMIL